MKLEISGTVLADSDSSDSSDLNATTAPTCYAKDLHLTGPESMPQSAYTSELMHPNTIYGVVGAGGCLDKSGNLADTQHAGSYSYGGAEQCAQACNADVSCEGFDTRSKNCHIYREIDIRSSDYDTTGEQYRAVCYRKKGFTSAGAYAPLTGEIFYKEVGAGYCIPDLAPADAVPGSEVGDVESAASADADDDYYTSDYYTSGYYAADDDDDYDYYSEDGGGGNRYGHVLHQLQLSTDRMAARATDGYFTEQRFPPYPNDDTVHSSSTASNDVTAYTCSVECNKQALRGW
jgi:hypothetical protein